MSNVMSPCGTATVQQPNCEPYVHKEPCCPPVKALGRPVCPIKVSTPDCEWEGNGCDPCECVPCPEGEIVMNEAAKAYMAQTITALLQTISPVERCDCKVVEQVGHDYPLKPQQTRNEMGQPLYNQVNMVVNPDGSVTSTTVQTTSATHSETGLANTPIFDDCCGAGASKHSAFLNSGMSSIRFRGGKGPGYMGGLSGDLNSREFHDRMSDLFCCALDKLNEVETIEVVAP